MSSMIISRGFQGICPDLPPAADFCLLLFASPGEGEHIAQLVIDTQQFATNAAVMTFRGALREIHKSFPQPVRQGSAALRK